MFLLAITQRDYEPPRVAPEFPQTMRYEASKPPEPLIDWRKAGAWVAILGACVGFWPWVFWMVFGR